MIRYAADDAADRPPAIYGRFTNGRRDTTQWQNAPFFSMARARARKSGLRARRDMMVR